MPGSIIQIGIVDDHAILRTSVKHLCSGQADICVVAEAASAREALDMVGAVALDVLVLDLAMPGQSGMDALPVLRAKAPAVHVLVFTGMPQEQYALAALNRGATGFLTKACDPDELLRAIRSVAQGQRYVPAGLEERFAPAFSSGVGELHEGLSAREMEALVRLAEGQSSLEVAKSMSLSAKTVNVYRTHIMRKLGLRTGSELTYYAVQHKLIE